MVREPKIHFKREANTYGIYPKRVGWQHLYCRGWVFMPETTLDENEVTCLRCKGMLAAEMFKREDKNED